MADSIELRMSVTSIKRVDPYVKDVLATATHVTLYSFNTVSNEWEKTETEGPLFIYSRNGEPYHSIMVMNRKNRDNLIEPIIKEFDYQMQVPFLLYRNSKNSIFGIWFYNGDECSRITWLVETIMEGLKGKSEDTAGKKENGIDIFSMLSKAQEDFNKTPTKQDALPFASTPRVPDGASQSVINFFARASTKSNQNVSVGNSENVLQRLMSNPAHSVEHIEKQQRSITPQDQINLKKKASTNADRRSVPISFPSTSGLSGETQILPENGLNFRTSPYKNQSSTSPLALLFQKNQQQEDVMNSSFTQFLDTTNKPQLMTPMMFQTSTKDKVEGSSVPLSHNQDERVDLLTEQQLAQALIYLLKNNTEFTKQIHQAYVNSIMEKVANSSVNKSLT